MTWSFYSYCNWYGQEDFTWQEIWRTCIYLSRVRWNDHLVNNFSLMYHYGINTNILNFKFLVITGISNERRNELTIYSILCRNVEILYRPGLASLFQVQEKLKTCRNSKWNFSNSYLQMTVSPKMIFCIFEAMSICKNIKWK